jgi:hypothetical protein
MFQFWGPVVAALSVGVLGWAVGIEPRIRVQKQEVIDLKELINVQLVNIDKRLERIERSLNGALKHGN